jgi:hypothetical protein
LRGRLATVAGLTALVAVGGGIAAAPAMAGPNCDRGNHCVFWMDINTARHSYFNTDRDFTDDTFNQANGDNRGLNARVDSNVWSASNSSTGGFESHYYDNVGGSGFLFCVNPGHYVNTHLGDGNPPPGTPNGAPLAVSLRDRASALVLRGTTPIDCY